MSEELENEGWIIEGGIITPEMSKKLCDDLRKWNRESHIKMFGGFTVEAQKSKQAAKKQAKVDKRREFCAIHEAGHAVIAHHFGALNYVQIGYDQKDLDHFGTNIDDVKKGMGGHTMHILKNFSCTSEYLMTVLGGAMATEEFLGHHRGSGDDSKVFKGICEKAGEDFEASIGYIYQKYEHLIAGWLPKIRQVATALLERGKLTSADLDVLIGEKTQAAAV